MHTFDFAPPRSTPTVPSLRPHPELPQPQGTPIYDALQAEFQRLYRTLPGDRSDEEGFSFTGFTPWNDASLPGSPEHALPFRRHEYASRRLSTGCTANAITQPYVYAPHGPTGRHRVALPPGRG